MLTLNGKKVKIAGKKYTVQDHLSNVDGNVETIILTRPIRKSAANTAPARTLQELGYTGEDDVIYTDTEMEVGDIQIKKKIGSTVMITIILAGDVLEDTKLEIIGPNWSHPNLIDIKFLSESEDDIHEIGRELLISSYLLYQERNNKFIPNKEEIKSVHDESPVPDLDEFLEGFKKFRDDKKSSGPETLLKDIRSSVEDMGGQKLTGLDEVLKNVSGLLEDTDDEKLTGLDAILKDITGLIDEIDDEIDKKDSSERRDSPEDLLNKILGSKSDVFDKFKPERETKDFSIEEIEMEDAPPAIQRLIRHLRNRKRRRN